MLFPGARGRDRGLHHPGVWGLRPPEGLPNYLSSIQDPQEAGRWIRVSWAENITDTYITTLYIQATERGGLVMDIATVLSSLNAKVRSLSARDTGTGSSTATVTLEVHSLAELRTIMGKLSAVQGVSEVNRFGG